MKNSLAKIGVFAMLVSGIYLGVEAIVAECKLHKAEKKLADTEVLLACHKIHGILKDSKIRQLEKENEKLKANCKGKGF